MSQETFAAIKAAPVLGRVVQENGVVYELRKIVTEEHGPCTILTTLSDVVSHHRTIKRKTNIALYDDTFDKLVRSLGYVKEGE